jgi:hypothetical protein
MASALLVLVMYPVYAGIATAARIPTITTTIMISMREKPFLFIDFLLFGYGSSLFIGSFKRLQ